MIDRTSKLILAAIALGLFANAVTPLVHPVTAKASESFSCNGELKASAFGGVTASIGGYAVDLSCH